MRTLIGPMACKDCRTHVWLVRRIIAYWCSSHGRTCTSPSIAPTVVEADGATHLCEHACYTATVGISDAPSRILLDALSVADTSREGVPRLEVSAP
jgi:hypothetical protein